VPEGLDIRGWVEAGEGGGNTTTKRESRCEQRQETPDLTNGHAMKFKKSKNGPIFPILNFRVHCQLMN